MENVALPIKIVSDFGKYFVSGFSFSESQDWDQDHIKEDHKHFKAFAKKFRFKTYLIL